jgi:DNA-binding Xre family transcriptional regulator
MENPIGIKIKQMIDNKKLSVARLEKIAGLQKGTVRDIIVGKSKNPTINTLTKICKALECTFNDLLSNEWMISQESTLLSGMNSYANMEWDYELFTKSMETIEKYLNKYQLSFKLNKAITLIIDLYLYSLTKNNKQIDEKAAEWLVEKLQVTIPIKIQD